jgi:hypothetical protein
MLDSRTVNLFQNGEYLVWNVTGSIAILTTNLNPNPNAILNGSSLS